MYGYPQYGSTYQQQQTAAAVNALTAAAYNSAAAVQQVQQQQSAAAAYPDYSQYGYGTGSVAATTYPSAYGQSAAAALSASAQPYGSSTAAATSRLTDAYAAAAAQQSASLGSMSSYSALAAAASAAAVQPATSFNSLRSSAVTSSGSGFQGSSYGGQSHYQVRQQQQSRGSGLGGGSLHSMGQGSGGGYGAGGGHSHGGGLFGSGAGPKASNPTFESKVMAAAQSYLHSKASGQQSTWMNKKTPGAGRGTFPQKTRFNGTGGGPPSAPRDAQQYYCEVCKISCAGQLTYKEHLDGQKHKKKEALVKGEQKPTLPKNKVSFHCELCNVTCTGQDTYNAHVRGAKHVKTLALCKKLGKHVPTDEQPKIIPPKELGGSAAAIAPKNKTAGVSNAPGVKKIIGVTAVQFVGAGKLSTTGALEANAEEKKKAVANAVGTAGLDKETSEQVEALIAAEQSVQPVGEEYVEAQCDQTGKLLQYHCKLCDCKFSDPNAKDIHLKGRRHRLQYKMKVNPNLEVEVKPNQKRNPRGVPIMPRPMPTPYAYNQAMPMGIGGYPRAWISGPGERRFDSRDDRHVNAKHALIYPSNEQLQAVDQLVITIEKGLKNVSDYFTERDAANSAPIVKQEEGTAMETQPAKESDRVLKGVMRVGLLAKQLIIKGDTEVCVVVLCGGYPTKALLEEVASLLPQKAETQVPLKVELSVPEAAFYVSFDDPTKPMRCKVAITSRVVREDSENKEANFTPPADALPSEKCLAALAELRHTKWFQARCPMLQSCQVILRIMRDVRRRVTLWSSLDDWASELFVERVLSSASCPLSVGDGLRRIFEAVASGVLFTCGPGLADPCEKERVDVFGKLTAQQREDITCSAQHALRLIAFNQVHKILNIEKLPERGTLNGDRKRAAGDSLGNVVGGAADVKKEKKDDDGVPQKMEV